MYFTHTMQQIYLFQPTLMLTISTVETDIARQEAVEPIVLLAVAHVLGEETGNELVDGFQSEGTAIGRRAGILLRTETTEGVLDGTPRRPFAPAGQEGRREGGVRG